MFTFCCSMFYYTMELVMDGWRKPFTNWLIHVLLKVNCFKVDDTQITYYHHDHPFLVKTILIMVVFRPNTSSSHRASPSQIKAIYMLSISKATKTAQIHNSITI
jgi:hypothetical protein